MGIAKAAIEHIRARRAVQLQVHNALGFAYLNMERNELAIKAYQQAVELQPGYVTAWNNLGVQGGILSLRGGTELCS